MSLRWITAAYDGWCGTKYNHLVSALNKCKDARIVKGDVVLHDDLAKVVYCEPCGKKLAAQGIKAGQAHKDTDNSINSRTSPTANT